VRKDGKGVGMGGKVSLSQDTRAEGRDTEQFERYNQ